MMYIYIVLSALGLIQGFAKSVSDSFIWGHWHSTIFSKKTGFWGINDGSQKYKNGNKAEGDRFFLSSTLLVFLTDAWHFFNFVQMICQVGSLFTVLCYLLGIKVALIVSLGFWGIRTGIFHVFYTNIFSLKK